MRLLVSAYACAPKHGSEHAVGWNWITAAHRLGHEVWAFASPAHRVAIEAACSEDRTLSGIRWFFPEVPFWCLKEGHDAKWERTHNLFWQVAALRLAQGLFCHVQFDAVHHLTWGGIRAPTFLGALGAPLIIGPIGGGEVPPPRMLKSLRLKAKLTEIIRNLSNATIWLNPIVRPGLNASSLIIAKTPESQALLPRAMQRKSMIYSEITLKPEQIGTARESQNAAPRFLFVGRLLYWKGGHIAIEAFACVQQKMPQARLSIVGQGPELAWLRRNVIARGLKEAVDFVSWIPRDQVTQYYESHDLLIFPSLHDSSGNAVLEALSRGLPVMCLDIGGPCRIVSPSSGLIIGTESRSTQQVAQAMAEEMLKLFTDTTRLSALSRGAVARASEFIAENRVELFYQFVAGILEHKENKLFLEEKNKKTFISVLAERSRP